MFSNENYFVNFAFQISQDTQFRFYESTDLTVLGGPLKIDRQDAPPFNKRGPGIGRLCDNESVANFQSDAIKKFYEI